ncbi:MAG: hypothetical protein ACREEM_29390 [Blastocatellia bacterium]
MWAKGSIVLEYDQDENHRRQTWRINDGKLRRPELPGLGIALTEEVMKKYAYIPGTANPGNFSFPR